MNKKYDIVVFLLAMTGFVLILIGYTDLGQMKAFRFFLGEVATIIALAHSFQAAHKPDKFTPIIMVAVWFTISSINFAQATWLIPR